VYSLFGRPIVDEEWNKVIGTNGLDGTAEFCIYVLVEYEDVLDPSVTHHTKDCMMYVPINNSMVQCFNDYADAD
jgi:hypothetical protein